MHAEQMEAGATGGDLHHLPRQVSAAMKPTIRIHGQTWTIRTFAAGEPGTPLHECDGLCDWTAKTIWIREPQPQLDFLETLIHELSHAFLGPERFASEFGRIARRALKITEHYWSE